MPDFNNRSLYIGDMVRVVCPSEPSALPYDNQHGEIVSTFPFGSGRTLRSAVRPALAAQLPVRRLRTAERPREKALAQRGG